MLETGFFFVSVVCWVKEVNGMWVRYVTFTRDLVGQGHVTLQVTYRISGPIHARGMNFFVSMVCWVKEVNGMWVRYVTFTRDLVDQGHVTLLVTYRISGPIHARDMNFVCFHDFLDQGSQWYVNQIRGFDAWPCTPRSGDLTSDLSYLGPYTC